jgi:uncharacterized protein YllA (UPF0747 family)
MQQIHSQALETIYRNIQLYLAKHSNIELIADKCEKELQDYLNKAIPQSVQQKVDFQVTKAKTEHLKKEVQAFEKQSLESPEPDLSDFNFIPFPDPWNDNYSLNDEYVHTSKNGKKPH